MENDFCLLVNEVIFNKKYFRIFHNFIQVNTKHWNIILSRKKNSGTSNTPDFNFNKTYKAYYSSTKKIGFTRLM